MANMIILQVEVHQNMIPVDISSEIIAKMSVNLIMPKPA